MKTIKTKNVVHYITAVILVFAMGACEKSDEGSSEKLSQTEKMLMGDWIKTKRENKLPDGDWYADTNTKCFLDATEKFSSDHSWLSFTSLECPDGGISIGNWSYISETNRLLLNEEGIEGTFVRTVSEINQETLILTHETGRIDKMISRTFYRRQ